jgi:hypothetical protein
MDSSSADGTTLAQTGESVVTNGSISLDVGQGQSITCDWYAVPADPILYHIPAELAVRGPARDLSTHA